MSIPTVIGRALDVKAIPRFAAFLTSVPILSTGTPCALLIPRIGSMSWPRRISSSRENESNESRNAGYHGLNGAYSALWGKVNRFLA